MTISTAVANRLGFVVLGLTNNFAYVIMLSAAFDLLNSVSHTPTEIPTSVQPNGNNVTANTVANNTKPYCNAHSTSTVLLADILPSLVIKIIYPFLLVDLSAAYKAVATALLTVAAFLVTGLSASQLLIFTGVVCASASSGLGESTYLSRTPLYGDVSLSGWSMGTGAAGLLGSGAYAVLSMFLSIKAIMLTMLCVPAAMLLSYFCLIEPTADSAPPSPPSASYKRRQTPPQPPDPATTQRTAAPADEATARKAMAAPETNASSGDMEISIETARIRHYGSRGELNSIDSTSPFAAVAQPQQAPQPLQGLSARLAFLPSLSKYFLPLLLVYFAEYFINQGLFELVYYPEISYLDHASQYRWFYVSYQLGVMISRSSLDFLQIKQIWTMSLLQLANTFLFLLHTSKLIHLPNFYLVVFIIIYEGLLGGFTYVNAFYRIKKEVASVHQEFAISSVTLADTLGIVIAGFTAIPVHDALCKLYE